MHVIPLVSKDGVFSAQLQYAIEFYIDCRDQERAALLARMKPSDFIRAMRRQDVKAEIQRKLDLIDQANAMLRAAARNLTSDFLDDRLVEAVKNGSTKGDARALELAYERVGMRRDGNFMTTDQSSTQTRPQIYRVLEHTVTRTEQVTERQIVAGEPAAPPTVDAGTMRLARATQDEILEY